MTYLGNLQRTQATTRRASSTHRSSSCSISFPLVSPELCNRLMCQRLELSCSNNAGRLVSEASPSALSITTPLGCSWSLTTRSLLRWQSRRRSGCLSVYTRPSHSPTKQHDRSTYAASLSSPWLGSRSSTRCATMRGISSIQGIYTKPLATTSPLLGSSTLVVMSPLPDTHSSLSSYHNVPQHPHNIPTTTTTLAL